MRLFTRSEASGRAKDASREATRRLASLRPSDVHIPEVHKPDLHMPDVHVPELRLPDLHLPQLRRRKPWYARVWPTAATLGLGAASAALATYFFDPDRGRARRAQTTDWLAGRARQGARTASRVGRKVSSDAAGWRHRVASATAHKEREPLDDATLAHKVETELFRDSSIPKGDLNINAENGVVVLRGVAQSPEQVKEIVTRVRGIEGVKDVHNLIHLPPIGTSQPEPEKTPAAV